ncbi:MAG TPA: VWA domain-containing protein, partial [Tepidisphaeraceae bacterium]|nr:VWA domain-containing protein [Tepidisphaeraceae bacterium]
MPSFLNLTAAAIAAGIVVPALLALYFLKLRRQEMSVASTFLWKKTIQDLQVNAPFQRLRRNLLLLLQLLLLALLLIALARPISSSKPVAGARTVILIDRSASMNATDGGDGRSRLDEAKRRATALVGTMSRDARAMVIAFDNTARIVQPFTSDTASLRSAIDSITPSDRPTSLKLAYQLADAQMQFDPDQMRASDNVDLFVYSDGRMSDAEELSTRGLVKFERLGSADSVNAGIVALSARRAYERPTQVQVFVRLANYGPNPVEGDLRLEVAPI